MLTESRFHGALRAFGIHLVVSCCITIFVAIVVFFLWYPRPYDSLQGGFQLFFLVACIDVVCGPLLTFLIFDLRKSKKELVIDLALICALQLGAFIYGVYVVWMARPIYLAFELDRFRVVSLADIDSGGWANLSGDIPPPSLYKVQLLGVRVASPGDPDYVQQLKLSLDGWHAAYRPNRWVRYEDLRFQVLEKSKPLQELLAKHPEAEGQIHKAIKDAGYAGSVRWMPVQSRWNSGWTALLSAESANVLAFVEVDGF